MTTPGPEAGSSSSSALVTTSTSGIPSRSTLQQRVLTEEAYTSTLSNLIRRDFFPQLERLEAENAYLDALTRVDEPGGEERLERAVRKLVGHEVRDGIVPPTPRPGDTVRGRRRQTETPMSSTPGSVYFDEEETPRIGRGRGEWDPTPQPHADTESERAASPPDEIQDEADRAPPLDGLTLSSFQAKYTSEDNASFLDIMKANEAKRREKYKWAYEAEAKANDKRQKSLMASHQQAKAGFKASLGKAPLDVQRRIAAGNAPKMITSNGEKGEQSDSMEIVARRQEELPELGLPEVSPALENAKSLQSWSHRARNSLFYGPDADRSTNSRRTSSLPISHKGNLRSIFAENGSSDNAPSIDFRNTRFAEDDDLDENASKGSETPRSSRIDAAIGGWAETASDGGASSSTTNISASPRVAGYSFVSPLPSPRPGDLGEERVRQLMTWGTVIGTPRAVSQAAARVEEEDEYDGSFRIPPTPSRDLLGRRLADKSSGSRKRTTPAVQQVVSKSPNKRRSRVDLSPAARSLLDKTSRGSTGLSSLGNSLLSGRDRRAAAETGARLKRERWTPSPSPRR